MEQTEVSEDAPSGTPINMESDDCKAWEGEAKQSTNIDSVYENDSCNDNEDEIHLDYDGVSDESWDEDASNSNEEKMLIQQQQQEVIMNDNGNAMTNDNDNEDEIRLDYEGVSDDSFTEEKDLNPCMSLTETTNDNDIKSSLDDDEGKDRMKENDEESNNDENHFNNEEQESFEHNHISAAKSRERSPKKDMQTLQSQQQRLQREAQFSIPYHKPKKYTLQEFLSRRTIMNPLKPKEENFCSKFVGKSKLKNLKMTKEELEVYSKLMEDRAKEASEFFRDENEENSNKTAEAENENENIESLTQIHKENMHVNNTNEQLEVTETIDRGEGEEKSGFPNVIITEVLELPKLDLKNVATELNLKEIAQQSVSPKAKTLFSLKSPNNIKPNILMTSPTLRGDFDITIDLFTNEKETPKPISRANSLLERLMKTNNGLKSKPKEENGLLGCNCISKPLIKKNDGCLNKKPGESLLQLKGNLKSLIMKKRREEIMKRCEEENEKKKLELDESDFDEQNEIDEEELEDELTSSESSDAEESAEESANELDDENGEEHVLVDDDQQISAGQTVTDAGISQLLRLSSFDESEELQPLTNTTEKLQPLNTTSALSQITKTQLGDREAEQDQLINFCSGTFETQQAEPVALGDDDEKIGNKIISSSDEEKSPLSSSNKSRTKRFTKKVKKSKMKLGFSDDEEDDEGDQKTKKNCDKSEEADAAENEDFVLADAEEEDEALDDDNQPTTYIDYDSEENEITVELTKEDCLKRAENFFEKEAELSDSEWGSADEDEKNLDNYDIELGDEDEFDKEEVRAQLEKIHARKMLDEDIRQVNKLQEMLLEDEEDESAKRQRKFRWKNFDTSFDINQQQQTTDVQAEDGSDEENEHLWRKIRYEREQTIKNHSLNEISLEAGTLITTPGASSDTRNVTIVTTVAKTKIGGSEEKEQSPFLISKELIRSENMKARNSFLLRNKKALTKTICSTKSGNNDMNTSPDKIGVKAINPSKFVFTTLTVEEHEQTLKRKADDSNPGFDMKIKKRIKAETRKSEYLIDKLL